MLTNCYSIGISLWDNHLFTIGLGHQREPRKRNRYCKQREFSQPNEISLANNKDVKPHYKMKRLTYENITINNMSVNQICQSYFPNRPQSLVILSIKHLNYFSTSLRIVFDSLRSILRLCRIVLNRI